MLTVQWADDEPMFARDYYCFYRAGALWWSGRSPFSAIDHAFVNPPFTLPMVIALAPAGPHGSYVVLAVLGTIGWILGCGLAARLGEASARRRTTIAIAMATAPSALLALHLGQLSGIYFALLAGSVALLAAGREREAGVAAALLLAKPNLVVLWVIAAVLTERRTFLRAFAITAGLLLLVSVPFGIEAWTDFFAGLTRLAHRHDVTFRDHYKQFTLYATLRSVTAGIAPSGWLARAIWTPAVIVAGGATAIVVRRLRGRIGEPAMMARIGSLAVLATCALNGYLFYYDAALLALPAGCLWLAACTWRRGSSRRIAIACAGIAWALQLQLAFVQRNPPLAGVVSMVWLAVDLFDLWPTARDAAEVAVRPAPASPG